MKNKTEKQQPNFAKFILEELLQEFHCYIDKFWIRGIVKDIAKPTLENIEKSYCNKTYFPIFIDDSVSCGCSFELVEEKNEESGHHLALVVHYVCITLVIHSIKRVFRSKYASEPIESSKEIDDLSTFILNKRKELFPNEEPIDITDL